MKREREIVRLVLSESEDYEMIVGGTAGIYTARVSRKRCGQWPFILMDFRGFYEAAGDFAQALAEPVQLEEAEALYRGHSYDEPYLREWESPVMVHSTTPEGYEGILKDGCIRSWNDLHESGDIRESAPIGAALCDPAALKDYIMLGGGRSTEIVVASREAGRLVMDENAVYRPGARLYHPSAIPNRLISARRSAHFSSENRVSGRRTSARQIPMISSAALTGIGLTSENSSFISGSRAS